MTIKAIETRYAGCRFRSRLEARWAVFFDELQIPWEYEPEGFETPAGWYLPDFKITLPGDTGSPYWFEVKRDGEGGDDRHRALAIGSGRPIVVARGMARSYRDQLKASLSTFRHLYGIGGRPDRAYYLAPTLYLASLDSMTSAPLYAFVGDEGTQCAFVGRSQGMIEDLMVGRRAQKRFHSGLFCGPYEMIHKGRWWSEDRCDDVHVALYRPGRHVPPDSPDVDAAYAAGRSARFEHGERQ